MVVKTVPQNSVVVGVPGQVVVRSKPRNGSGKPDLNHNNLPDTIGETLAVLVEHVNALEERLEGHTLEVHAPLHTTEQGIWRGEDFSI